MDSAQYELKITWAINCNQLIVIVVIRAMFKVNIFLENIHLNNVARLTVNNDECDIITPISISGSRVILRTQAIPREALPYSHDL